MDDATQYLQAPEAPAPSIGKGWVDFAEIGSALSPTYWGNELIKEMTGFDLFGSVGKFVAGDWEEMAKAGIALGNLADFCRAEGANLQQIATKLDAGWDGNAADGAYEYFTNVATTVMQLQEPLAGAPEKYIETAKGMWQLGSQATNLAEALVDSLIVAAAAAAAGTALVETGVGAVVGWGIAAIEIARAIQMISKLTAIAVTADMIVMTFISMIKMLENQISGFERFVLPADAYTFPAR
ncbi:hypothetical protein [Dactylosporangium matsuzakiense]|uniref:Type VII secretion system (Wss) protein ESAT-6 n=1 Tax=Dactylosporangium matsuzakiense TaxID=53360 RepID=A0A9W6NQ34_9ACTN|nr:hypothetical protein [Dactylosporangium matsuzakiense]GLL05114.1 hypothetical protein GCM10017581_068610 [Dactylosporangium matsuzakiense]